MFSLLIWSQLFLIDYNQLLGLQGMTVKFNKDGDAPGRYDIFQYQKIKESTLIAVNQSVDNSTNLNYSPPEYDYIRIGNWESDVT